MDKSIVIDGIDISYTDEGEGNVLLLFHGWGAKKEAFAPIIKRMSKNMRVVAFDFPGFGKSGEPKEAWDVDRYALFAKTFIEALGLEDAVWLGHSFGGRVIIKLYEKVAVRPEKIVLVDSAGIKPKRGADYYIKVYTYKAGKKLLSLPFLKNTSLYERFVKNAGSNDYRGLSENMRTTFSKVVNEDLREHLPKIKASVLLIWGENDTATPFSDAEIMDSLLPDSGIVRLEGAGHYSYLDRPQKFFAALEYFLK